MNFFYLKVVYVQYTLLIHLISCIGSHGNEVTNIFSFLNNFKGTNLRHQRRTQQQQVTTPIERIEVINALTDTVIANLSNQMMIVLNNYNLTSATQLNFNAVPAAMSGSGMLPVKSVRFALDSNPNFRTENGAPYAACGNSGNDFGTCPTLMAKQYTMTATSWSNSSASGTAGMPLQFTFTIMTSPPVSSPMQAPVSLPVSSPIEAPLSPPAEAPVSSPMSSPIGDPVSPPVPPPVSPPVSTPVSPTAETPVSSPMMSPIVSPMSSPIGAPVSPPTSPTAVPPVSQSTPQCSTPKLLGSWESYKSLPIPVAESQGMEFGHDFVIFGGFSGTFNATTNRTFALDLRNATSNQWVEKDPVPMSPGHSHVAVASVGNTTYICGGFVGGTPGPATDKCFVYEHHNPPGTQWRPFKSLPGPRGGAAMFYDKATNTLTLATGASRPKPSSPGYTIDHNETWAFNLSNPDGEWVYKGTAPYHANHIGRVTFEYQGVEHHMMLGGQIDKRESDGNVDDVFELFANSHTWVRRQSMPFPRGHFSESSIPYKDCGFIIIAGAINGASVTRTSDISYYDYGNNTWTSIGNLTKALPTPVCIIHEGYIYCQSGPVGSSFAVRRAII